jgi:hypothetical protein
VVPLQPAATDAYRVRKHELRKIPMVKENLVSLFITHKLKKYINQMPSGKQLLIFSWFLYLNNHGHL